MFCQFTFFQLGYIFLIISHFHLKFNNKSNTILSTEKSQCTHIEVSRTTVMLEFTKSLVLHTMNSLSKIKLSY